MKRWAVFDIVDYYPSGGMSDFVAAFETKEEAEAYVASRVDQRMDLFVEDMEDFLSRPSPEPWPKDKQNAYFTAKREAHDLAMQDPLGKALYECARNLERDLYGDGSK